MSGIASADPVVFGEGGVSFGGVHHWVSVAGTAGVGERLLHSGTASLWLRESLAAGELSGILDSGGGSVTRAQIGLEGRVCTDQYGACFLAGVEGGYQHEDFTGSEFSFSDTPPSIDEHNDNAIVVARVGGDFGNEVYRFRPVIDFVRGPAPATGGDFSMTVAVNF